MPQSSEKSISNKNNLYFTMSDNIGHVFYLSWFVFMHLFFECKEKCTRTNQTNTAKFYNLRIIVEISTECKREVVLTILFYQFLACHRNNQHREKNLFLNSFGHIAVL